MAGIGFELQKLSLQENIGGRVASFGHGAIVAAGPWLLTIISLGLIGVLSEGSVDLAVRSTFRVAIIYAFALSLILTAPTVMVSSRMLSDALYQKRPDKAIPILFAALLIAGIKAALVTGWLYFSVYDLPLQLAVSGFVACLLVSFLWVVLNYCGAVYDHRGVTFSFIFGMLSGLVGAVVLAINVPGAPGMIWGFNIGLTVTLFSLLARVLATFPFRLADPVEALRQFVRGMVRYELIAFGALFGAIAVWIDKWIVWHSPFGETITEGLLHSPLYDSAMFVAYLAIIPSLAFFVIHLETDFFRNYIRYYNDIENHATLSQIEESSEKLGQQTLSTIHSIMLLQFGVCAFVAVFAPLIVDVLDMQFRQISILRFGAVGTLFHFIFLASSSVVLFLDRKLAFMMLQALFLLLNSAFTIASLALGARYLGGGYFLASLVSGLIAYMVMIAVLGKVNYHTFIGNIPVGEAK